MSIRKCSRTVDPGREERPQLLVWDGLPADANRPLSFNQAFTWTPSARYMDPLSRRRVLAASLGSLGWAGCLSQDSAARYRLSARNVPGDLAEHLRWTPRGAFTERQVEAMRRLVTDGSLTTAGFALLGPDDVRFVEHDGSFYRVSINRSGTAKRERWVFRFDLIEGDPPADADVYESSLGNGGGTDLQAAYDLSELDARAVEDAAGDVYREGPPLEDLDDAPAGRRGHVFVHRGADESALIPEPPFTHVAFETNDATRYARAVVERATVELQQYEYTATRIADSDAAYAAHVQETVLQANFDPADLPESQREILETITDGGGRYNETRPLSAALTSVLDRLGLSGMTTPEEGSVAFSEDVFFRYREGYHRAQVEIFR